jgi:Zn finger protein HypA/HybF involved in hydrogenase expression
MQTLKFDCSICAKLYGDGRQLHALTKGAELTLHEWFAQCAGCGSFSIKIVDDTLVKQL